MWIAVSTPVAVLIATVLMERFERRCALGESPRATGRPVTRANARRIQQVSQAKW